MYVHERKGWPNFKWDDEQLLQILAEVRHHQGKLLGRMEGLGFQQKEEASLQTLTEDVIKSSAIENEILPVDQVRSSIARRLGLDIAGMVHSERGVDGVVEMMMDATQHFEKPLTDKRLFGWHSALFPTGKSGMYPITVGSWRSSRNDPMQVVSGPMGKEKVHFVAPEASRLKTEMDRFFHWFNNFNSIDTLLKAGVAHLWFVTVHPLEDGNGRVARAIADMQISRSDKSSQRFYSMSSQIRTERKEYYSLLEKTQRGDLDITPWLTWFLQCLNRAIANSEVRLSGVLTRSKFWERNSSMDFNSRQRIMLTKLLDDFEGKLTSSKWAKMVKCSQDTSLRDIQDLVDKKILEKEPGGGRSTSYRLVLSL
ncbi:MAG: Fic family protein [Cyclobacteriaceae bacterium]